MHEPPPDTALSVSALKAIGAAEGSGLARETIGVDTCAHAERLPICAILSHSARFHPITILDGI